MQLRIKPRQYATASDAPTKRGAECGLRKARRYTCATMPHTMTELVMGTTPTVIEETRPFWEGTLAEELRVQVCGACGNVQLPGGPCCTTCLDRNLTWRASNGCGAVFSFTVVRHAFNPLFATPVPYVLADIQLDDGPTFTSNITDVDPDEVRIGMRVRAWFDTQIEDAFHTPLRLPKFRPEA